MLQVVTSKEIITPDADELEFSGSSKPEETETSDALNRSLSLITSATPMFFQNLLPLIEADLSTVYPLIKSTNETWKLGASTAELVPVEMLESDIVVRMRPKKAYAVSLQVKGIKKGMPKIVDPQG